VGSETVMDPAGAACNIKADQYYSKARNDIELLDAQDYY
jgi:hypothetical protein